MYSHPRAQPFVPYSRLATGLDRLEMENLLPEVASADVTSNQFREKSLPYQQWEVGRMRQHESNIGSCIERCDLCQRHRLNQLHKCNTPKLSLYARLALTGEANISRA